MRMQRPRRNDPDFFSALRYIEYLGEYCTHFDLWPSIYLSTPVLAVTRRPGGGHLVAYRAEGSPGPQEWECDAVAVCSGLHVVPNIPKLVGIEHVPTVLHSSQFKRREQFGIDKTVLVLGSGETGADISYLAVTSSTRRVVLSHRQGFHFAPKRNPSPDILPILGRKPESSRPLAAPLDCSRASLFDTAYVHPWLRNHTALWTFYDCYVKSILWLTGGTTGGFDQWVGSHAPGRGDASMIFFNKSLKACPYISAPYRPRKKAIVEAVRSALISAPIVDTGGRQIDLAPWPERIDADGVVHFRDNGRPEYERMKSQPVRPDIVVFCTGYRQEYPFFRESGGGGRPYPTAADADVRNIWRRDDPTVAFMGFVRPALGAIPPLAEMQAQLWVLRLAAPDRIPRPLLPSEQPHYRTLHPPGSRVQYGVDHESYVYQLALDMDSAPSAREVADLAWRAGGDRLWRLPLVWALGANFTTKFRLRGPWTWDGAVDVLADGLWPTITRRGWFFGHFTQTVLPMSIFGPVTLVVFLYAQSYGLYELVMRKAKVIEGKVVSWGGASNRFDGTGWWARPEPRRVPQPLSDWVMS